MADSINEQWFDALIRHQIGLLRLSNGIQKQIFEILDATEKDIRRQIRIRLSKSQSVAAQERLIKSITAIRNDAWVKSAAVWRKEMLDLMKNEPEFLANTLKTIAPVELSLALPAIDTLAALAKTHPFEGQVLSSWAKQIRLTDLRRMEQQIRIGVVQGESSAAIARRVVGTKNLRGTNGVTEITRRNAAAITRTAVNSFSNAAKRAFYLANSDIFDEELYVATLDSRTTPICRSLDGKTFPIGKGPIPPLHWSCRSLRVGTLDGKAVGFRPAKPVTQRMLVREYAKKHNLGTISSRAALPRGHKGAFDTFAQGRIRQLVGQVEGDVTYQVWLTRQTAAFQDEVLGVTKAKLFRKGKMPLDKFVNRKGDELTLSQMADLDGHAKFFKAAGLNPDDF